MDLLRGRGLRNVIISLTFRTLFGVSAAWLGDVTADLEMRFG